MIEVCKGDVIEVYGATFCGGRELKQVASSQQPKGGVYVGMRIERVPCFDSYDYAYDHRYTAEFVFARSENDLSLKQEVLNNPSKYPGLDKREALLAPVVYWSWDADKPDEETSLFVPQCEEIVVIKAHDINDVDTPDEDTLFVPQCDDVVVAEELDRKTIQPIAVKQCKEKSHMRCLMERLKAWITGKHL